MSNEAALRVLEPKLEEAVRKVRTLLTVINELRVEDGQDPLPPLGGGPGPTTGPQSSAGATISSIRPDTFYGKKMQTAIREYLEMRKAQGLGPAKPREIYDAITAGGYQFEAKEEHTALVGMRALLRKRSHFFHKLPNGTYGLTSWYPDARKPKAQPTNGNQEEQDDDTLNTTTATPPTGGAAVA